MSKYHPLDVRHPANRENERRSYLLAPLDLTLPAATPAPPAAESRRQASRTSPDRGARATPAAPWGRPAAASSAPIESAPAVAPATTQRPGSGFAGFLRSLFFLLLFVVLVATQTDLLDPVLTEIRYRALDLGIRLPF